jgi:hypothetical protein
LDVDRQQLRIKHGPEINSALLKGEHDHEKGRTDEVAFTIFTSLESNIHQDRQAIKEDDDEAVTERTIVSPTSKVEHRAGKKKFKQVDALSRHVLVVTTDQPLTKDTVR